MTGTPPNPPSSIDAEQAVLGAIFVNNEAFARVASIIRPEYFFEPIHSRIFELCSDAIQDGRAATPITIRSRFPDGVDVCGLTPIQYMARLMADATTVVNAPDYALLVRDKWAARRIMEVSGEASESLGSHEADPKSAIATLLHDLDTIRAELDHRRSARQSIAGCVSDVLERIDLIKDGRIPTGASTGLRDLDAAIGGLQPGRLVVIAGRPGMGKTITGANFARATAQAGNGCAVFSLEMPSEEIAARILSDHAYTEDIVTTSRQIFEGTLDARQMKRIEGAAHDITRLPLLIDSSPSLTVSEICARSRSAADELRRGGVELKVIVIDYLKFVKASDRYRGNRVYEVGEITAGLKALAKDLGICVVLLAQLNRNVEQRADKRPELSDLRESGDIEADADIVLLLFREAYYLQDKAAHDQEAAAKLQSCMNLLEIIVAKCRMGSTGTVEVFCHPGASVLRNW
ncbi:MAG: DnaB-like helicase C-terminal domain-containing protein [Pseudomonadota bacterium]